MSAFFHKFGDRGGKLSHLQNNAAPQLTVDISFLSPARNTFARLAQTHWLSVLGKAILAFAATNIDDIFVLTLFFAQKNLRRWHVIVGQYLGLAGLIAISLVGYFARLFIPHTWIGLLGLAPIAIGIKKLIDWKRGKEGTTENKPSAASVLTVAAVTFANGGDNIGIYVPLFATSDATSLLVTLITFAVLIAVWSSLGYHLGNHSAVKRIVDRYGHVLVPFVLIGLGAYIIVQSR